MPRLARVVFNPLRSSLVNLPISIYGTLVRQQIRPQTLAVHLSFARSSTSQGNSGENKSAYVGWSGLAASPSLSPNTDVETIEIDPQFAASLGFKAGDIMEIGLLYDLPPATTVSAEPFTVDDWEIIETHAAYVERNLIAQVRVACIGQELGVWVFGQTRIRLRVSSLEPQTHKHSAALLVNDTEVVIAPKSRTKPSAGTNVPIPLDSRPDHASSNKAEKNSGLQRCRAILRSVPSALFPKLSESTTGNGAWVSKATFSYLSQSKSISSADKILVSVKLLKPPKDAAKDSNSSSAPAASTKNGEGKLSDDLRLWLRWNAHVPLSHVALSRTFWRVKEGDIVCLSPVHEEGSPSPEDNSAETLKNDDSVEPNKHAGTESIVRSCVDHLLRYMTLQSISASSPSASGILITGGTGTGKTSIATAVAARLQSDTRLNARPFVINLMQHAEDSVAVIKGLFESTFTKAAWHRPSVIVFDDLDKIIGAELEHSDSFRSRQLAALFLATISSWHGNAAGISFIVTASSDSALHPLLTSAHLFSLTVHLKAPGVDVRRDVLTKIVESKALDDAGQSINITNIVALTEGYSISDLGDFVANVRYAAALRSLREGTANSDKHPLILRPEDFTKAHSEFTPFSLRDVGLQKSGTSWNDIGGLTESRLILRETLEWPTKYGPIFAQSPLRLRSGLLLYGYPGCGKTLLASAVAKECGLNFIGVKGPELLNKYIGASEKSVRDLFERASAAKPCVLFFDEFDSIAPKRGHDSTGVTDRVVNQMLTQMDGAEGLSGVYVLAATSRPDLIDSALLRPGRLDKLILCDMPSKEERKEILEVVSRKLHVSDTVGWDYYADKTEGFSGADLQALVYNAHLDVIHSSIEDAVASSTNKQDGASGSQRVEHVEIQGTKKATVTSQAEGSKLMNRLRRTVMDSQEGVAGYEGDTDNIADNGAESRTHQSEITDEHLMRSLATTRPSVSPEERIRLTRIYRAFISDRDGELPHPPESGVVGSRATLA